MASDTGGVKPFSIQGRMARERERVRGMTDEERMWRSQWLKDQELLPNEPRNIAKLYNESINPIRRAYRMPLDMAFKPLIPVLVRKINIYIAVVDTDSFSCMTELS
jgi:NADH dehydrogenase (ubiquinone) 1 beta subcomplex subunit 6